MFYFDNLQSARDIYHPWKILYFVNLTCPSSRGWQALLSLVSCFSTNIGKVFLPFSSVDQMFTFVVELFFSSHFFLKLIRRHILRVLSTPTGPYKLKIFSLSKCFPPFPFVFFFSSINLLYFLLFPLCASPSLQMRYFTFPRHFPKTFPIHFSSFPSLFFFAQAEQFFF